MDARGSIPAGDEPADLHDGRLGVGTGPLGGGPPGSALRGSSMVGGPANPRRRGGWMAIQVAPTAATRHPPPYKGVQVGAPESLREEDDGEVAQPELATSVSHTSRGAVQLRSSPEGLAQQQDLGRSSAFFRYRSHSSFVDGRDACLVIVCLPAGCDERDPRHASASSAAAEPRVAQQGHMKRRRIREDGSVGLVQIRSCPRITEQKSKDRMIGRLDRHAHGARGVRGPKQAVIELARPAPAARNPRRGSTGRGRRDNVCKNS